MGGGLSMKTIYIWITAAMLTMFASPAAAEWKTFSHGELRIVESPVTSMRSTSVAESINSAYASSPSLYDDGTPVHPYAPRRAKMDIIIEPDEDDDDLPIGDAALPLILLAAGYIIVRTRKGVKRLNC